MVSAYFFGARNSGWTRVEITTIAVFLKPCALKSPENYVLNLYIPFQFLATKMSLILTWGYSLLVSNAWKCTQHAAHITSLIWTLGQSRRGKPLPSDLAYHQPTQLKNFTYHYSWITSTPIPKGTLPSILTCIGWRKSVLRQGQEKVKDSFKRCYLQDGWWINDQKWPKAQVMMMPLK